MVITLTTDFGADGPYVGVMKGVILGLAPGATVVDLAHDIPPQDVGAAAYVLDSAVDYFPKGSIHVVVVDPGVGTSRRGIAVGTERGVFIGPDNGVFTLVLERYWARGAVSLTDSEYHLPVVSSTFHGRDIFAPVAGHLANGIALEKLGELVDTDTLFKLDLPGAKRVGDGIEAHAIYIDRFGNLITDLSGDELKEWCGRRAFSAVEVAVGGERVKGIGRTYGECGEGQLIGYIGSSGRLEIAVRNGSAAEALGMGGGAVVRLNYPAASSGVCP